MTSKTQTMLIIALTVAVTALLVDRIIEPAQADVGQYVLIATGITGTSAHGIVQDFNSEGACEMAGNVYRSQIGNRSILLSTTCIPK